MSQSQSQSGNKAWSVTPEQAAAIISRLQPPTPEQDATALRSSAPDRAVYRAPSPYAAVCAAHILKQARTHPPAAFVGSGLRLQSLEHAEMIARGDFSPPPPSSTWDPTLYVRPASFNYAKCFSLYHRAYFTVASKSGWDGQIPAAVHLNAIGGADIDNEHGVLSDPHVEIIPDPTNLDITIYRFSDSSYICAQGYRVVPTRHVLAPWKLTLSEVNAITDGDLRSSVISRWAGPSSSTHQGWLRYLNESDATVLHTYHDPLTDTDEALLQTNKDSSLFLVCTCPTARLFVIPVPQTDGPNPIRTCDDARRWITGGPRPIART